MIALLLLAATAALASPASCTTERCERTVTLLESPENGQVDWDDVRKTYRGIRGFDPRGESLATAADGRRVPVASDGIHDWFPGGRKTSLCGELREFGDNCLLGGALVGECDLNNFVQPDAAWRFLADFFACSASRIQPRRRPLDAHTRLDTVSQGVPCHAPQVKSGTLEAEITVPPHARRFLRRLDQPKRPFGPWRRDAGDGLWWLEDPAQVPAGRICAYGPWVLDTGHGNHPEIHPAEMIFWNAGADHDRQGPYFMMLLQDASGRFGQEQGYRLTHAPGERWRPWSRGPLHGRFEIALRFDRGAGFELAPLFGRASQARRWILSAPQGPPLLEVSSTLDLPACPPDRDARRPRDAPDECLSVHVQDVVEVGDQYRALLVIEARVGGPEPWQEGALLLRLDAARAGAGSLAQRDERSPERALKAAAARAAYEPLAEPPPPTPHLAWDAAAASIDWGAAASGADDLASSVRRLAWVNDATTMPPTLTFPDKWETAARFDLWASRWQVKAAAVPRGGNSPRGLSEAKLEADRGFDWSGVRCRDLATGETLSCEVRPRRGARTSLTVTGRPRGLVQVEIPLGAGSGEDPVKVWPGRVTLDAAAVWELLDRVCPPLLWPDAPSPSLPSLHELVDDFVVRLGPKYTVDELDFLVRKARDACVKGRADATP